MLVRLRISGYALIDEVEVEFGPGLNVLTGETGAGKSILVDSMALLLGARAAAETIRVGADRATVEGLFADGEREALVRREIVRDRSNRCYLDGGLATAKMLREEGERWVDLHGQHEDRLLVRPSAQRELLDAYAGAGDLAERVARVAVGLGALDRERGVLEKERAEREDRQEYLLSQVAEIEASRLDPGDEEALEVEAGRLRHSAERGRLSAEAHDALEGAEESLAAALAGLQRRVDRLAELDPDLAALRERFAGARYELEDLGRELGRYAGAVEHDPGRLADVEARRDLLARLKRKHGPTLEAVLDRRRVMAAELRELKARGDREQALDGEQRRLRAELAAVAGALADAREAAADRLAAAVEGRLTQLGMGDGTFRVELPRRADADGVAWQGGRYAWTRSGIEEVSFLIAPNAGEAPRPLAQVASGGELSRVLLALKAALAEADRTPTLIFDEIDAGIGGVVAHHVARQLRAVAARHQVIVVTHLAQIAAAAQRHIVVEKSMTMGRTVTVVRTLEGPDRVVEISRLLGGDPERAVSLHHARELLEGRV